MITINPANNKQEIITMTAREKWESVMQERPVVHFFAGLFERVGVHVVDSGEEFTCVHQGEHITFEPSIDPERVDYVVEIQSFQIDRLAEHAKTGAFDEVERYRIISTLFTPATAASLKNPILSNRIVRRLAGAEDLIHVYLKSPTPEEKDINHTLIFVRGQWLVVPGLYGKPGRVYRLTLEDAQTYQRQAFAAMKAKGWAELLAFSRWYRQWRTSVSARA